MNLKIKSAAVAQTTAEAKALMAAIKNNKKAGGFLWKAGNIEWHERKARPVFIASLKNNKPSTLAQAAADLSLKYNYIFITLDSEKAAHVIGFDTEKRKATKTDATLSGPKDKDGRWGGYIINDTWEPEYTRIHAAAVVVILQEKGDGPRIIEEKRKARKEAQTGALARYIDNYNNITGKWERTHTERRYYGEITVDRSGYNTEKAQQLQDKAHEIHRENEQKAADNYNRETMLADLDVKKTLIIEMIQTMQRAFNDRLLKAIKTNPDEVKEITENFTTGTEKATETWKDIHELGDHLKKAGYFSSIDEIKEAHESACNDYKKLYYYFDKFIKGEKLDSWWSINKEDYINILKN